jgi:hypothetical protein
MAIDTFEDIHRVMPEITEVSAVMWHASMLEKMSPEQISSYFSANELEECAGFSHTQRKNE